MQSKDPYGAGTTRLHRGILTADAYYSPAGANLHSTPSRKSSTDSTPHHEPCGDSRPRLSGGPGPSGRKPPGTAWRATFRIDQRGKDAKSTARLQPEEPALSGGGAL